MSATNSHETISAMRLQDRLRGVVGIAITPFDRSGAIDEAALRANLDYLVANGIDVVTACGNTSEYFSLTDAECRRVIALTCEHLGGRATVIAGVGHDHQTASAQAKHAEDCGADAVMVHHPPHPFLGGFGYMRYVRTIVDAVKIGVIPYLRSANVQDTSLHELTRLEGIVAVKYAINDLPRFGSIANHPSAGDVTWICGTAETWAPFFWAVGATGFTSGLVNVAPKLSLALFNALRCGRAEEVIRLWTFIKPFEDLRGRNGSELNVSVVKEAMAQLGLGLRHVRPPISELEPTDRASVAALLKEWELA